MHIVTLENLFQYILQASLPVLWFLRTEGRFAALHQWQQLIAATSSAPAAQQVYADTSGDLVPGGLFATRPSLSRSAA